MKKVVSIIDTGVANIASVRSAFSKLGVESRFVESPDDVFESSAVILPGVGSFESGMSALRAMEAVLPLRLRIEGGKPTLAVCLGMQLLCESSEENPGVAGVGVIPGSVQRFGQGVRVPHFGWNEVTSAAPYFGSGYAYFANSYRLEKAPVGWEVARTDHGGEFISAVRMGHVVAAQFHPEISGTYGRFFLSAWLDGVEW